MVLKSNQIQHCTRRRNTNDMFGMFLFIQTFFFDMERYVKKYRNH